MSPPRIKDFGLTVPAAVKAALHDFQCGEAGPRSGLKEEGLV
jgi:hypothetical protein